MVDVRWLAGALSWLMACAATGPEISVTRSALRRGDPDAPPDFAALPDVPSAQQSPRTLRGLSLAREVLQRGLPAAPDDRRYAVLQRWIDQSVVAWVEGRRDSLDETRFQFELDREPTPQPASAAEGGIGWGVLALMEENTAQELTRIPSPSELDTEPEIADMYRDLVATQARPFRSAALQKYRRCHELSREAGRALADWTDFCAQRYEKVQRALNP